MDKKEKTSKLHWKQVNAIDRRLDNHGILKANAKEKLKNLGSVEFQEAIYHIQNLEDNKFL